MVGSSAPRPHLSRRHFAVSLAATSSLYAASKRPNVLVFMTDQQSALLPGSVHRPAFESIRSRGVEFTSAFCNTPQCSPARSSLLTGLEPHHSGVLTNVDATSLGKALSPRLPTVGTVFRNAGYRTGYFGKWHLGNEASSDLQPFGFTNYSHGADLASAQAAADWIQNQSEPSLAWVSVLNPHDIYRITGRNLSVTPRSGVRAPATTIADLLSNPTDHPEAQRKYMSNDQGRPVLHYSAADWVRYRTYYCDLVEKADQCLASVLKAVNLADTIIVFTSDHGDALGEHGLPFKGPFMYDPLIRIPLVIAAPGLPPNSRRDDFALSIDVAPTLAALAGIKWPAPIDGKDLSRHPSDRDAIFLEYNGKQHWMTPIQTIRTRRWKLNRYATGEGELYDLKNDPNESSNVFKNPKFASIRENLNRRISQWWATAHSTESARLE